MTPEAFEAALPAALDLVAEDDADGDGVANRDEIIAGTSPADAADLPGAVRPCAGPNGNPDWNVCGYDAAYVWRKLHLDVCGESPSYEALLAFKALPEGSTRMAAVDAALDTCLDSDFWLGRDGALWQLAHRKIRPLQAIKQGRNRGPVPLADYDHDYALFAYTQSDDRDARLALTADFHVRFTEDPPHYEAVPTWPDERLETTRRAGMITTRWFFTINTMFTPVPRTTAAQAYRAYLGLDIARSEGLVPPAGALVDYDDKGVTHPTCAGCHETLDPLAYPFSRYEGILSVASGTYNGLRMLRFGTEEGRRVREVPEAGALFGEPVDDLIEWARKAADSDAFAQATVRDYWRLLIGHDPTPAERREFDALWRDFREVHGWRVEYMLHDLVRTEAYGAP
ncbi:MAG: hypothetical protein KC620_20325 [Myxococcales bacterium]|nr:hypothetical protein [Myxococcales bacterium]